MSSHPGNNEEQMYLVDVFVEKLILTPENFKEVGKSPLVVAVRLLDFPKFEMTSKDFKAITPASPNEEECSIDFSCGRSCLFVKRPRDLARNLKSKAIMVGVFRVGDTYPIAETDIILYGCLCDQISMTSNDQDNLPRPFKVTGGFLLNDPGNNHAAQLDMEVRLSCFGRIFVNRHGMGVDIYALKNGKTEDKPSKSGEDQITKSTLKPEKKIKKEKKKKGKGKKKK